jgi:hypothetical protein
MAGTIIPSAKAIYLCDFHVGYSNGKVDLYGLFNSIRPAAYPHRKGSFVCFAQLLGGLGVVSFHIDIRRSVDQHLIDWTGTRSLHFPDRDTLLQIAVTIPGCVFHQPELYLVELYCDNAWVADTTLRLLETRP